MQQNHDHDHAHSHLDEMELRVRALETLLTRKGFVETAALDRIIETYETRVGPHNGAAVVARAWVDPEFHHWLMQDATAAIASMGFGGRQGEHMVAVANTPEQHNMVVCTLCSCYPWPVLGLPPVWYKSAPYRSRAVREPRACARRGAADRRRFGASGPAPARRATDAAQHREAGGRQARAPAAAPGRQHAPARAGGRARPRACGLLIHPAMNPSTHQTLASPGPRRGFNRSWERPGVFL